VSEFIRVNDKRWYSVSSTTHMQEIRDAGEANEKRYLPDQGSGYIWRLYSTARMEENEDGVLLEFEAVALSRGIPATLRWFVDPIVRRVARDSLEKSLNATAEAARQHSEACAMQTAHSQSGPNRRPSLTMVAGVCAHRNTAYHASNPDLRAQKFSSKPLR
jgi:hypothetical protein